MILTPFFFIATAVSEILVASKKYFDEIQVKYHPLCIENKLTPQYTHRPSVLYKVHLHSFSYDEMHCILSAMNK